MPDLYAEHLVCDRDGTLRNMLGREITRLEHEIAELESQERIVVTRKSTFTGEVLSYCPRDDQIKWLNKRLDEVLAIRRQWPDHDLAAKAAERWEAETADRYPDMVLLPATEEAFGGPGGQVSALTKTPEMIAPHAVWTSHHEAMAKLDALSDHMADYEAKVS